MIDVIANKVKQSHNMGLLQLLELSSDREN